MFNLEKECEVRQKTGQLEKGAVSKALAILSRDDAHHLFTKICTPALLQTDSAANSARRVQAPMMLSVVAAKLHHPRLATLAYQIRHDAFTHVKQAIDHIIAEFPPEKYYEIKHKDSCTEEFSQTSCRQWRMGVSSSTLAARSRIWRFSS
jgi:hypothetical protein